MYKSHKRRKSFTNPGKNKKSRCERKKDFNKHFTDYETESEIEPTHFKNDDEYSDDEYEKEAEVILIESSDEEVELKELELEVEEEKVILVESSDEEEELEEDNDILCLKVILSYDTLEYIKEKGKNEKLLEDIEENMGFNSYDMRNSYFEIEEIAEKLYGEKCDSCKLKDRNLKYIVYIGKNKYYVGTHCILRYEFIKGVFDILKNDNITLRDIKFQIKTFDKTIGWIERKIKSFYCDNGDVDVDDDDSE
jgi:hypothetical protein